MSAFVAHHFGLFLAFFWLSWNRSADTTALCGRRTGMDKLHTSMLTYVKSMSQRKEGDDREKMLPVDVLAQAMIAHGEEFESDSLFGTCLISKSSEAPR